MMLQSIAWDQDDRSTYPTSGVKIGISYHDQTLGKHRPRFAFSPEVAKILGRGLAYPRVHIDGSFVNGMRIWCQEEGGMAPTHTQGGTWAVTVPVRRVRGREDVVHSLEVAIQWERDETGPVLLIPRVPDELLSRPVLDKLPNSQVDARTIMDRADKRLQRDMRKLYEEAAALDDEAVTSAEPEPEPEPQGEPIAPLAPTIVDLKDALAMVNELVDQLGDEVVLSIDGRGHVRAKRRIVQYLDL